MTELKGLRKGFRVRAVLFDFDGTLTGPGHLDFPAIKRAVGCPESMPVLEFIESLVDEENRARAMDILHSHEIDAAARSRPNTGAEEALLMLAGRGIPTGIITRNSREAVDRALKNFMRIDDSFFSVIVSREASVRPKPHGDGIHHGAEILGIDAADILVVGDYVFDIEAGNSAGSTTVFLSNGADIPREMESDFIISGLHELEDIVNLGLPLDTGKLPNELLEKFLAEFTVQDSSVIVSPGIGEDCAAVDIEGGEVLILKSDPITFTAESAGHYAVLVNANDIATTGAIPRWFLTTLLFPPGSTASLVYTVISDLHEVTKRHGITLCGGHTEITDAVTRPVVSGMMAGLVARERLLDKRNMKPGDMIIMTKTAGVEGTSILAREFSAELMRGGMSAEEIQQGMAFIEKIGILHEARIASSLEGVRAMHDVTEGGIATALAELAAAGQHGISVDMDAILRSPLTEKMCRILGADSLGLIGSGSLLICCDAAIVGSLMEKCAAAGIGTALIGRVLEKGKDISAVRGDQPVPWPLFKTDELARLFRKGDAADS